MDEIKFERPSRPKKDSLKEICKKMHHHPQIELHLKLFPEHVIVDSETYIEMIRIINGE